MAKKFCLPYFPFVPSQSSRGWGGGGGGVVVKIGVGGSDAKERVSRF